jgi:hypothetical protein
VDKIWKIDIINMQLFVAKILGSFTITLIKE